MRLLFDIGGTSLRAARETPEGISPVRIVPTPYEPNEAIRALADLGRQLAAEIGAEEKIESAAGGVAGVIRKSGTVMLSPNLRGFEGYPFAAKLTEAIGAPARIANDAALGALGEAHFGAGKGSRIVAYITIGTGVGGARVIDGKLDPATAGFEPGHQIVDVHQGMSLEALVSGRAVEKRAGALRTTDAPRAVYEELTPILAAGLYNAALFWSPDLIVLGGGMMQEGGYRAEELAREIGRLPKIFPELPRVVAGALGDSAGLWGARVLAAESSEDARRVY